MRTRLVRVRRRPRGVIWAVILLMMALALYIRVSLPALKKMQAEEKESGALAAGERVTREITVDAISAYLVSFGGYDVMNSAKVEAARYVSRGAAGYVLSRDKLYVIGAGYAEKAEAEKACVYLAASEGMACTVAEVYSPAVTMRMTAGSAQIEAFLLAERTLRDSAGALGQLAFSIDRGEATARQALEVVGTHMKRVEEAKERLENQAEGTDNEVFLGLQALLEGMAEQMEEMRGETKAMTLSSRLKYCHVDFRVREIEMMNALAR